MNHNLEAIYKLKYNHSCSNTKAGRRQVEYINNVRKEMPKKAKKKKSPTISKVDSLKGLVVKYLAKLIRKEKRLK